MEVLRLRLDRDFVSAPSRIRLENTWHNSLVVIISFPVASLLGALPPSCIYRMYVRMWHLPYQLCGFWNGTRVAKLVTQHDNSTQLSYGMAFRSSSVVWDLAATHVILRVLEQAQPAKQSRLCKSVNQSLYQ